MLSSISFHKAHIVVAVVVGALIHLSLHAVDAFLHLLDIGESLLCLFAHGSVVLQNHHLRQIANSDIGLHTNGACRRMLHPTKNFQKRGLSCTVFTHKGDAVTLIDDEGSIAKQRFHAELHRQPFNRNHQFSLLLV